MFSGLKSWKGQRQIFTCERFSIPVHNVVLFLLRITFRVSKINYYEYYLTFDLTSVR